MACNWEGSQYLLPSTSTAPTLPFVLECCKSRNGEGAVMLPATANKSHRGVRGTLILYISPISSPLSSLPLCLYLLHLPSYDMPYYMYCTSCSLVVAHERVTCLVRFMSMLPRPWQRDPHLCSLWISSASRSVSVSSQYVLCLLWISSASSPPASLLVGTSWTGPGSPLHEGPIVEIRSK